MNFIEYFNNWRKNYDTYTLDDQKRIINKLEEKYPNQKQFSRGEIYKFFLNRTCKKIVEIGGWKGDLANEVLNNNKTIELWNNYDICSNAKDKAICKDVRYNCIIPDDFVWNLNQFETYDTCILSHVIEHIKEEELQKLFIKLKNIKHIYIAAPIDKDKNNWNNYCGTHILKCGWNKVSAMLKGYKEEIVNNGVRFYTKA